MKVLYLTFDFPEFSVRLASALAEYVDVCLVVPQADAQPYLKWLSPKVQFAPFDKARLRQPLRQLCLMNRLIRCIRQFDPDLIHLQKGQLYFNLCLPLVRRIPLVVSVHDPQRHVGDKAGAPQWLLNFGVQQARHVIAHNISMREIIVERLGISEERISVVPHIELGDPTVAPDVEEAGHEVLFFGRIRKYKGLEYLIRAQPLITDRIPEAKIVIAGEGDDFTKYRNAMPNPNRFEVHNEFVPDGKQAELFRQASVVVLPYIEATQSGIIPLAYTYEKPVVASAVGGLPSQVDDGITGFLVPPGDVRALADKVVLLLENPALQRRFGRNGKRKVAREWSADVVAKQTIEVYQQTLRNVSARLSEVVIDKS